MGFLKVFFKGALEFQLGDRYFVSSLVVFFILYLTEPNRSINKNNSKKSTICFYSSNYFKSILILLVEALIVYMWFFNIQIRKPSLKKTLTRLIVERCFGIYIDL